MNCISIKLFKKEKAKEPQPLDKYRVNDTPWESQPGLVKEPRLCRDKGWWACGQFCMEGGQRADPTSKALQGLD